MNNICPVCGYDFKEPIEDSMICVCCGTQYGYHDSVFSYADLRDKWLESGAKWHSRRVLPPLDWSLVAQLHNIGYSTNATEKNTLPEPMWAFAIMGRRVANNASMCITKIVCTSSEVVAVATSATVLHDGDGHYAGSGTAFYGHSPLYGQSLCRVY